MTQRHLLVAQDLKLLVLRIKCRFQQEVQCGERLLVVASKHLRLRQQLQNLPNNFLVVKHVRLCQVQYCATVVDAIRVVLFVVAAVSNAKVNLQQIGHVEGHLENRDQVRQHAD